MKLFFLFVPVLPLLLGGCSGLNSAGTLLPPPPPAVRIADRTTVWGDRPSYDAKGQYFYHMSRTFSHAYVLDGTTALDLLVNRDGRVQQMAVVASSGDVATDRMAMSMYWHARYSLQLEPAAPAPFVVRETVVFRGHSSKQILSGSTDASQIQPLPTTENYNAGNTNNVNGWVR